MMEVDSTHSLRDLSELSMLLILYAGIQLTYIDIANSLWGGLFGCR